MTKTKKKQHIKYEKEEKVRLITHTEGDKIEEVEEDAEVSKMENETGCSYYWKKVWRGYVACIEATITGVYSCLVGTKNGICNCLGCIFYPIKQRLCDCCDDVDKDLNPFKNPNYNPYDHL
jgi:hypothetical protein